MRTGLMGVCLPRLPPRCAGREQEWGAGQTCYFARWGSSHIFCDLITVYSCVCCCLVVCYLPCARLSNGAHLYTSLGVRVGRKGEAG